MDEGTDDFQICHWVNLVREYPVSVEYPVDPGTERIVRHDPYRVRVLDTIAIPVLSATIPLSNDQSQSVPVYLWSTF